jgi:hypothetical protein
MKFLNLLKSVRLLKSFFNFLFLFTILFFSACDNSNKQKSLESNLQLKKQLSEKDIIDLIQKKYGENAIKIMNGEFLPSDSSHRAVCYEVSEDTIWAIKFIFIKVDKDSIYEIWQTQNLEGSFNEAEVKLYRPENLNYDLVFYDSKNYYAGNDLGEVFLYAIDLNQKKTNYAHAFYDQTTPPSVYFSPEIDNEIIQKFYFNLLRKRFETLRLAKKDYKFEEFF